MKQLSVRGFEPELVEALKKLSEDEGISLSQAALRLMRAGAGLDSRGRSRIGHSLDDFIGTMSDDEVSDFRRAIAPCEQIDESFWQ